MNPGASVLLNSNVSVRFYLTKPDTLVNFDNYKFGYVKSNNDLGAYGAIHYIEETSGYYKLDETYYQSKDGVKAVNNDVDVQTNVIEVDGCEQTQYFIDVPVCAREFADTITITVTGNNGENPLFETRTYSVKEYCQKRIANHANDDINCEEGKNGLATRKLAMAMLDYGTAMQKYKNYNTDNLANAEVLNAYNAMVVKTTPTEEEKTAYENYFGTGTTTPTKTLDKLVAEDASTTVGSGHAYTEYATPKTETSLGIRLYGKSLSLEDNVKVYFYFAVGMIKKADGTLLKKIPVNTFEFKDKDGKVLPVYCADEKNNIYYVVADGLAASDLESQYEVCVNVNSENAYGLEGTLDVKYSPLQYCDAMNDDATVGSLCQTIVNYWNAAEAVFEITN